MPVLTKFKKRILRGARNALNYSADNVPIYLTSRLPSDLLFAVLEGQLVQGPSY